MKSEIINGIKTGALIGWTCWLGVCSFTEAFLRMTEYETCKGKILSPVEEFTKETLFGGTKHMTTYYIDTNSDKIADRIKEISDNPNKPKFQAGDSVCVSTPFFAGPFRRLMTRIEKVK